MTDTHSRIGALAELPPELLPAVVEFRAQHGAKWKRDLMTGWLRAAFPGELQQLRNQFGPDWLARVKDAEFDAFAPDQDASGAGIFRQAMTAIERQINVDAGVPIEVTEPAPRASRMRM